MPDKVHPFRTFVLAALAAVSVGVAAQAQDTGTPDDARLVNPGMLTVGTSDPVYPPWMMNDDPASGEGFESALIYALADEMGFAADQVQWVRQTFEQIIAPGDKPFDFAINQVSVTPARAEVMGFSQVYYQSDKAVIALPGSPVIGAASFDDLRSARWGAAIGTTDLAYLETVMGVADVAVYDDQVGVFQAMQAGQIDATVAAVPTALFATAVQIPEASIVAILPPDAADEGHGLIFEQGSPLIPWVDAALSSLIAAGTVQELVETWLVADPDLPIITE
ncbi:ABC transporter substrate-binding protein [Pararhodobacter zhoushanensis]|uniref:ABC transporter substrate-binding protein n=1 Tax=Pararhodobacter zhoushanensis TaxID=2479545 RepID=A0ABT3GXB7_9RHOB|nr:ABC transporter substrate-binding protein [Pararhodobacter zhoushanensis]MCW1932198.1 ABC transporter substrate-binding protein [Pararhodobacter zhoushanensis]